MVAGLSVCLSVQALRSERDSLLEELQRVREEYNRLRGEHERDLDVASLPEEEEEGEGEEC